MQLCASITQGAGQRQRAALTGPPPHPLPRLPLPTIPVRWIKVAAQPDASDPPPTPIPLPSTPHLPPRPWCGRRRGMEQWRRATMLISQRCSRGVQRHPASCCDCIQEFKARLHPLCEIAQFSMLPRTGGPSAQCVPFGPRTSPCSRPIVWVLPKQSTVLPNDTPPRWPRGARGDTLTTTTSRTMFATATRTTADATTTQPAPHLSRLWVPTGNPSVSS